MADWQIGTEEYLKRLGLDQPGFERHLKIPRFEEITQIVPLRELTRIVSITPIHSDTLLYLIRRIKTLRLFENHSLLLDIM
ncbi:MAG: hypothetical protein A2925_01255 [Candidatus Yanofskybacteria bacterium RIFCSPLOWO2_01_FULL_44_22]|uniref:Uncharacterized protein n=2 Tax=Candidatus Yanofskyibacteriota TaxID=1752733 RepID=A0A1F8GMY2_9BACT|nr:MAG: hypothetical protein UW79_C0024G0018 [Candidatus Yanofskybacteria bacterium GW2011_GWA2_44_9]OGN04411.1 MAG: hypothetical protein A2659_03725 [Candidatus Yanofskybacteria bacterium RIFCSPHIGHO2_01_FULL_44_24]OGN25799.1 MAG: hypothetical protein A2925_01255 [Candidatus Yanofskybacteria bacterium RIFCSPLOWO2_01_FULL_44_22]